MSESPYRAAIIGLGFIGGADQISGDALGQQVSDLNGTHVDALSRQPRVQLVAGSSRDPGRRERFEQRTGVRTYSDWKEMLEREELDIVSVATYAPQHAEMTIDCARKGIRAIYCEKPVATTVADAHKMLAACAEAGSLLVINHNRRFDPGYRRLRDLIGVGDLGELTSASLQWPTGRLGNVGTHMIDAVQMLTGRPVQAVSGVLDLTGRPDCRGSEFRDPGGWGLLRLEGNLMVTVDAADNANLPVQIVINGTEGRAIVGGNEIVLEYWDGRRDVWSNGKNETTSMDRAVTEIVAALDGDAAFPYSSDDAVRTLEAITAFHISHARNAQWTELPLTGADREVEVRSG